MCRHLQTDAPALQSLPTRQPTLGFEAEIMSCATRFRSQVNDMFSEFRRFIAPTYYHDRCERSLHMHLYVMHKREVLAAMASFVCSFVLLLFIGLAGPNVTKLDVTKASETFKLNGLNASTATQLLQTGPFDIYTPTVSTYSQHLSLYVTFFLKNEEASETFNTEFVIALRIEGITGTPTDVKTRIEILNEDISRDGGGNHHLFCSVKRCNPIQVFHLEFLEYQHYNFEVTFRNLESVHQKYGIEDIRFGFQSINTSFTTLTIWFKFVFLVTAFFVTCWFTHALHRYPFVEWSMEQKWTAILLPLLVLYNNPFFSTMFLFGSSIPRLMDIVFKTTFYAVLLLFWQVFFHGIRQTSRPLAKFYFPKLLICGSFFLTVTYVSCWSRIARLEKPTLDEESAFQSSSILQMCAYIFYASILVYAVYLTCLVLTACTELRSMPYFDLRIKLQGFLVSISLTIAAFVVIMSVPSSLPSSLSPTLVEKENEVTKVHMLQLLPWTYESSSSASFLTLLSITNLYVFFCAYFYCPSKTSLHESRVIRDDPTISMMNDSDEDIIYASDMDRPLNQIRLIEHGEDDDESD